MAAPQAAATAAGGLSNAGKIFFGSLCAGTFGLGVWQTVRLFEKQSQMEEREAELSMEPTMQLPTTANNNSIDSKGSFRRVVLQGKYDHSREFLVGPRGPPPGALPDKPGRSGGGMSSSPQGYFVMTPLLLAANDDAEMNDTTDSVVIVNRGWVPRNLVVADNYRGRYQPQPQQPIKNVGVKREGPTTAETESNLLQWDRPNDQVQVLVIPSKGEKPRFLVAQHDFSQFPPRLFWFDRVAMHVAAGLGISDEDNDNNNNNNNKIAPYVTAVRNDHDTSNHNTSWPVQPTADKLGEFKVSPAIHAGYAFTWFGLSGAGMYMTRMLLTKGRG